MLFHQTQQFAGSFMIAFARCHFRQLPQRLLIFVVDLRLYFIAAADVLGGVKNSLQDGEIFVNGNGVMSLNGWNTVKSTVTNLSSTISALETLLKSAFKFRSKYEYSLDIFDF